MLFKMIHLEKIASGDITVAFRRWQRPTVKTGGTLTTAVGVLAIDAVDVIPRKGIVASDATRAGFASPAELMRELDKRGDHPIYRVRFRLVGEDPRVALRNNPDWSDEEVRALCAKFEKTDARSQDGPWTRQVLRQIAENPRTRAPELAARLSMDTRVFKNRVRTLKGHGLTESMQIGYRLSPRGEAFVRLTGLDVAKAATPAEASDNVRASMRAWVKGKGVVLESAAGPVPTVAYEVAGERFNTNWKGHVQAQRIQDVLGDLARDEETLSCRLCEGKKTFVHRRLWPHLVVLSPRLDPERTCVLEEAVGARGAFRVKTTPLEEWVPDAVWAAASAMSEQEALDGLGWWLAPALDG